VQYHSLQYLNKTITYLLTYFHTVYLSAMHKKRSSKYTQKSKSDTKETRKKISNTSHHTIYTGL